MVDMIYPVEKAKDNAKKYDEFCSKMLNKKSFYEQMGYEMEETVTVRHETIVSIIDWMISEHLILKTKAKYPVLHSTFEGLHYSKNITVQKLKKIKKYLEEEVILWN